MLKPWEPRRVTRVLTGSGIVAITTSLVALILGLFMVQTGARDFRSSVAVSGDAITAILDTVEIVNSATAEMQAGLDAAADGVSGVSATATVGAASIEDVAAFLEQDLPDDLEAIRSALPAAIQAAAAIDGTLRALSFVGVNYSPQEPFDDSLRRVEEALVDLPDDLRVQGESLRDLVPAASGLAGEADRLSLALQQLGDDLDGIHEITTAYNDTLTGAAMTLAQTEQNFDRNLWLLRIVLVALALGGTALGVGLIALARLIAHSVGLRTYTVDG